MVMNNETQNARNGFPYDVICSYSRKQAIEDGVLVDLRQGDLDEVVGQHFNYPTACTSAVWNIIENAIFAEGFCNDLKGVVHDICWMARFPKKRIDPTTCLFEVIITGANGSGNYDPKDNTYLLKIVCGPGDDAEPVLTIMLPDED